MIDLNKDKKYLLACSFGPDSMALFDMLEKDKINFSVAHVNYNLRAESSQETRNLYSYCVEKNIEVFILDNKEKINSNIEERCREIRYNFFQEIYERGNFDALLVAHNEDDNIETYLLQQKRKNLVLFNGISCKSSLFSMNVIRPLLGIKKSFLLEYCKTNSVPYAIDSSNLEDNYLRNQIRHNIVEKLSGVERANIIEEINSKNESLKYLLKRVEDFNSNKVSDLLKVEEEAFPYLVNKLAREINGQSEISSRLCNEIKKALNSDKPNIAVRLKKDFAFVKEYDEFHFSFIKQKDYEFCVNLGDIIDNEFLYFDTNFDLDKRNLTTDDFPIKISNAKVSDQVIIKDYEVQLRRLFIDWKMPTRIRNVWPVIRNKNGKIVYVPRYQKNFDKSLSKGFYVKL